MDVCSASIHSGCLAFPLSIGCDTFHIGGCHPCLVNNVCNTFSLKHGGKGPVLLGKASFNIRFNVKYSVCLPFFGLYPRLGFDFNLMSLLRGSQDSLASLRLVGCPGSLSGTASQVIALAFGFR